MKDIAKSLSITVDAVSKALRDSPEISEATKAKVRQKASELGYVKNSIAVFLKTGTTKNVAVFINGLYNMYFAVMCDKILYELAKNGYNGILCFAPGHLLQKADIQSVITNHCSLAISLVEPSDEVADVFVQNDIPLYLIGIQPRSSEVHYAITDDYNGGYKVGEYYALNPFKKALFVTDSPSETSVRRFHGFTDAIGALSHKTYAYLPYDVKGDLIELAAKKINDEQFDFVFCFSDFVAYRLKVAIQKIAPGREVVIFGYDNISEFTKTYEPINSVAADYEQIAKDVVHDALNRHSATNEKPERMALTYPVKLVIY